jgi:hypothetical protein
MNREDYGGELGNFIDHVNTKFDATANLYERLFERVKILEKELSGISRYLKRHVGYCRNCERGECK